MYRFANPECLYAMLIIPVLILVFVLSLRSRRKALEKFADAGIIGKLIPKYASGRPVFKFVLFALAICFTILGIANPQIGSKYEEVKREGIELIIALDVSNSMLAEDFQPNRLEKSKQAISKLVDKLRGDKIGIIIFAGDAYVQLPVTTDYGAAKLFLSTIDTDIIPTQGTAIGAAISLAMKSFSKDEGKNRAIIVISDGENHEDDAFEQAQEAASKGIVVHTMGIGSIEGTPIPYFVNKRPAGYRKDRDGNTIVTKLNETLLQQIASAGGGNYVRASNMQYSLNLLFDSINKMEKKEFESKMFTDYEDRFQYFLAVALILLLIEFLFPDRKMSWMSNFNIFEPKKKS